MAIQLSIPVRNARQDQVQVAIGITPKLQIFTGDVELDCAAIDSGTKLAEIILPNNWLTAADLGTNFKSGTWSTAALAIGVAGHFRIKDSTGILCHMQGTVALPGDGVDMTLSDTNIVVVGQAVVVNSFSLTDGNA